MNGWMTCDFTSFSTIFQSFQEHLGDNQRLSAAETHFVVGKISDSNGLKPRTARSVGQCLTC